MIQTNDGSTMNENDDDDDRTTMNDQERTTERATSKTSNGQTNNEQRAKPIKRGFGTGNATAASNENDGNE